MANVRSQEAVGRIVKDRILELETEGVSSNKWMLDHDFENNLDTSQLLWDKEDISSLLTCVSLCNANSSCRSIFYHPSLKKCLGSQSYKRGHPNGQSVQHGWKYYTKPTQCDLDYTFNKTLGLCYKLYSERRTHFEAMDVCEAEGAKLIIIRNDMEFAIVQHAVEDTFEERKWHGTLKCSQQ